MQSNKESLTVEWKQRRLADLEKRLAMHEETRRYPELIKAMRACLTREKEELNDMLQ